MCCSNTQCSRIYFVLVRQNERKNTKGRSLSYNALVNNYWRKAIVQCILFRYRRLPRWLAGIEEMANLFRSHGNGGRVSKHCCHQHFVSLQQLKNSDCHNLRKSCLSNSRISFQPNTFNAAINAMPDACYCTVQYFGLSPQHLLHAIIQESSSAFYWQIWIWKLPPHLTISY